MIQKIIQQLKSEYGIHSILLYGSRAGDDFREDSDYDLLCLRPEGKRVREILEMEGLTIDLIVDDESILLRPDEVQYLWQSQILLDENGFAQKLLSAALTYINSPAHPLPPNRVKQRKKQVQDSLVYIKTTNLLGNYRRHDLLAKLLPLYFDLKGVRYLGDKHALKWLEVHEPKLYQAFEKALSKEADIAEIEELALKVTE